jgi:hypothetical protein
MSCVLNSTPLGSAGLFPRLGHVSSFVYFVTSQNATRFVFYFLFLTLIVTLAGVCWTFTSEFQVYLFGCTMRSYFGLAYKCPS